GLTYPQYIALRVLWHRGPITVRDLGGTLHLDSGTLSPLLKRLEAQGHIRRERGVADERTVWTHLTAAGTQLRDELADLPHRIGCNGQGGVQLQATIEAEIPDVDQDAAHELLEAAHQVCPYSNATRGNIEVTSTLA